MSQDALKTPLHAEHLLLGARMIEYAGWHLPIQYTDIMAEHLAVRSSAGLFDVSHMGEIEVSGSAASLFLQYLLPRNLGKMLTDKAYYSPMCADDGGTVDDLIVYPLTVERFVLVVNAANTTKDYTHIMNIAGRWAQSSGQPPVKVSELSSSYSQMALQGPGAVDILVKLYPEVADLKPYHFIGMEQLKGCLISRTGYTGEDGFEIYLKPERAPTLWRLLIELGAVPIGLGARDSLRLEAGMPLYGHELAADITPFEAGLGRFVDLEKPAPGFVGQKALRQSAPRRRLIGLRSRGRAIPRAGYPVMLNGDGQSIGTITSGGFSPTMQVGIGMALIDNSVSLDDKEICVLIREKNEPFEICPLPFYRRQTAN